MADLVLATLGTWGDLFPAIGLAHGLRAAGHSVRIATSPSYGDLVEAEGLAFTPIGPSLGFSEYAAEPKILSGRMGGLAGFSHVFNRFIFPNLDRYVTDLSEALGGVDLLLAHPALIAAPIAAEVSQVKLATFSVFPGLIPTTRAHPMPHRSPTVPGSLGRAFNRASWKAAQLNMRRLFDAPINQARSQVGLSPIKNAFFWPISSEAPYFILASSTVIDPPSDWPAQILLTGFVTWDRLAPWREPEDLRLFLAGPEPPVLITLGASSSLDPQTFYADAIGEVTNLGRRALVLTGPTPTPLDLPANDRIFSVAFAPLSVVARHCCAAVHHGGVGTTVALLHAGLPQLVVPRGFDQPHTAQRVAKLGVGRTLPWRKAGPKKLRLELSALLGNDRYRQNAVALRARLNEEDGLARTVQAVTQAVNG